MLVGLDQLFDGRLSALRRRLRDSRVGLLTHAAAIDRRGRSAVRVLEELGASPTIVFSPEHGFDSFAQAEEPVPSPAEPRGSPTAAERSAPTTPVEASTDSNSETNSETRAEASAERGDPPRTSAPARIISLYGDSKDSLSPRPEDLAQLDVLLIDLVDVGSRYYTYVWTALLAARAAAKAGVHVLVLDRPNPLSGDPATLEGAPQAEGFTSFVGLEPLPIRHALTLAEIVVHFAARDGLALGPDGAVSVVQTRGWERLRTASAWGRPFILPSPNMPTLETALVYPGGCLVEGTNLSEGRGTTVPFQTVGAPFLDGQKLAQDLVALGVPGALVRAVTFRPTFEKHAHQTCSGVMLHVTDASMFRPVTAYLHLIALARAQAPDAFRFRTEPYEFEAAIPAFDLLTGSAAARTALSEGARPEDVAALVGPVDPAWREVVVEAEAALERARA